MNKKVNLYRSFIIILLLLIFISSFFICFFYNFKENKFIKKIQSEVKAYSEYKVINGDGTSSFETLADIDKLDILYSYILTLNASSTIKNNYHIVGNLIIKKDNNELYREELFSLDKKLKNEYANMVNIKENGTIDFKKDYINYQSLKEIEKYKDASFIIQYRLVNNLEIYNSYLDKKNFQTDEVILTIDLNNNAIKNASFKKNKILYGKVNMGTCYAICFEFFSSIILFLLIIILLLRKIFIIKKSFIYRLNKILVKYDDLIVNVKNLPKLDNLDLIMVTSFKELIDVHQKVNLPINYLDIKNKYEATFVVILTNAIYVYKMK